MRYIRNNVNPIDMAYKRLGTAVIIQAFEDLSGNDAHKAFSAFQFLAGPKGQFFLEGVGIGYDLQAELPKICKRIVRRKKINNDALIVKISKLSPSGIRKMVEEMK